MLLFTGDARLDMALAIFAVSAAVCSLVVWSAGAVAVAACIIRMFVDRYTDPMPPSPPSHAHLTMLREAIWSRDTTIATMVQCNDTLRHTMNVVLTKRARAHHTQTQTRKTEDSPRASTRTAESAKRLFSRARRDCLHAVADIHRDTTLKRMGLVALREAVRRRATKGLVIVPECADAVAW
jgi:hypothetical protein